MRRVQSDPSFLYNKRLPDDITQNDPIAKRTKLSDGSYVLSEFYNISSQKEKSLYSKPLSLQNWDVVMEQLKKKSYSRLIQEQENFNLETKEQEERLKDTLKLKGNMVANMILHVDSYITVKNQMKESQVTTSTTTLEEFFLAILQEYDVTLKERILKPYTELYYSKCRLLKENTKEEKMNELLSCSNPEASMKLYDIDNSEEQFGEGFRADACIIYVKSKLENTHIHNVPIIIILENNKEIFFKVCINIMYISLY
jgi:hypothetical protein